MDKDYHLPKADKISTLAAVILFSYVLMPYIRSKGQDINFSLFNIAFQFQLNFSLLISIASGIMAAVGTDWVIHDHPKLNSQSTVPHLITPSITAWAIGIPLNLISLGPQWWVSFMLGSSVLLLSIIAEYIAIDTEDARYPTAVMFITALISAQLSILLISLRAARYRLYSYFLISLPLFFFFTSRILQFHNKQKMNYEKAVVITLFVSQWIIGLHFWPLPPLSFGLAIVGPAYFIYTIITPMNLDQKKRLAALDQF